MDVVNVVYVDVMLIIWVWYWFNMILLLGGLFLLFLDSVCVMFGKLEVMLVWCVVLVIVCGLLLSLSISW